MAPQLFQEGCLDIKCILVVVCGEMLDLLYWIIVLTRVTTSRLPCTIRPTFSCVAHSAIKLDLVATIVRVFQFNVTSRTGDWLNWGITCIMHPSFELPEFTTHEVRVEVGHAEVVDCD